MPKPVVAAINGAVAGAGLGIALACDLRWAARSAVFATAFTGIGLAGDSGITWSLSRLVGTAKTSALMYLNERISAEGALELGLVNAVVDDELLADSARELALRLAAGPTAAFAAIKKHARRGRHAEPAPSRWRSRLICRSRSGRRPTISAASSRSSPRRSRPSPVTEPAAG